MSKGKPRVTVRISPQLLEEIQVELASQAEHSPRGPEDVSLFIVRAIRERIAKRRRSRAPRRARAAESEVSWDDVVTLVTPHGNADGSWL